MLEQDEVSGSVNTTTCTVSSGCCQEVSQACYKSWLCFRLAVRLIEGDGLPLRLSLLIYKARTAVGARSTAFLAPRMLSAWPGAQHSRELSFAWLLFITLSFSVLMKKPLQCRSLGPVQSHMPARQGSYTRSTLLFFHPICFTSGSVMGDKAGPTNTMLNS